MSRAAIVAVFVLFLATTSQPFAQQSKTSDFVPVTDEMLRNPSANDWLMFSRTYDAQRYSPLTQINKQNVGRLTQAWTRPLAAGVIENIPIVYRGVMYVEVPTQADGMVRTAVQALDATNGSLIWEYVRPAGGPSRAKTLAIFEDLIIFAAPDSVIVALDAGTGEVRWETKSTGGLSSGTIVF